MDITEALLILLESGGVRNVWSVKGKVISIDTEKRTCEVEPFNDDANLIDVKLQSSESGETGVLFIPEEDSDVTVHFLDDDEAYVTKTSKVSKIELITENGDLLLNGEDLGGLIKIEELKTQLAKNTQRIDTIINVLKTTITSVSLQPNPSWSGIITPILSVLQKENYSNIENEKVKHG